MSSEPTRNAVNQQGDAFPPRSFAAGDVVLSCEPWVWSFQYHYYKILCAWCFTESGDLKTCSKCKLYRYCDARCQAASWQKEHKHECGMLQKINMELAAYDGRFDHECCLGIYGCGTLFGCCATEILIAKIINKVMRKEHDELPGFVGKHSAMGVLAMLPADPENTDVSTLVNFLVTSVSWPLSARKTLPNIGDITKKVCHNAFPIMEQRSKLRLMGIGIFPQAPYRLMTPVCWDINVTMDFQGRTLVVRATENIPIYSGLKDLRQNERLYKNYYVTLKERRKGFQELYGHLCNCRRCTDDYDADINPLKCATPDCRARIPSDQRALDACPQCGAINGDRLAKLKALIQDFLSMEDGVGNPEILRTCVSRFMNILKEVDSTVHPDAHFRLVCGFNMADYLQAMGRSEEAVKLCPGMIDCVRAIYPTYHLGRARYLTKAGAIVHIWANSVCAQYRHEQMAVFADILPKARDWLREAHEIYKKLGGENSMWATLVAKLIADNTPTPGAWLGRKGVTAMHPNWDLTSTQSILKW